MGYLPLAWEKTEAEVFERFQRKVVLEAYAKAAAEMGFRRGDSSYYLDFVRDETPEHPAGEITIKLEKYNNGTVHLAQKKTIPAWISQGGETVWAVGDETTWVLGTDTLYVWTGSGFLGKKRDYALRLELLERFAKNLPEHCFVYVPSQEDGRGGHSPAFIANNKQKFFFVMPKSAEQKN